MTTIAATPEWTVCGEEKKQQNRTTGKSWPGCTRKADAYAISCDDIKYR